MNWRVCVIITTVLLVACTNYSSVPPGSYSTLEPSPRHGYRLTTRDQREYIVTKLSVHDSTIVLHELRESSAPTDVPVVLSFEQVRQIDRIEVNTFTPLVLGVCVVALVILLTDLMNSIPALD